MGYLGVKSPVPQKAVSSELTAFLFLLFTRVCSCWSYNFIEIPDGIIGLSIQYRLYGFIQRIRLCTKQKQFTFFLLYDIISLSVRAVRSTSVWLVKTRAASYPKDMDAFVSSTHPSVHIPTHLHSDMSTLRIPQ